MKGLSNHPSRDSEVLQYRPELDAVQQKLQEFYEKGHCPSTAYELLKLDLLLEFPDSYHEKVANEHYLPSMAFCSNEYSKLFNAKSTPCQERDKWFKDLVKCCEKYNNDAHEGKASVFLKSGHLVVAVCTPVMQRTHTLIEQAKEIMIVRAVVHKEKPNTAVYCLTTTSAVGDVPLGYIITDTESKEVLVAGLTAFHTVLPIEAFYYQGYPNVIMTSDELKDPLATGFPNSVLLTSQSCVLRAVWKWLWDPENGIDLFDRQELFQAFKASMLASSEEELFESFQQSIVEPLTILQKYENFVGYMSSLWDRREEWASAYPCVSKTSTSMDIVQRIVGDHIFRQMHSFNIPQMFDFLVWQYESYVQKYLANCTNGQFIGSLLRSVLPAKGGIDAVMILELQKFLYQVPSEVDSYTSFTVDLDIGICSCEDGSSGMVCQHQSAVIEKFKIGDSACLTLDEDTAVEQSICTPEMTEADKVSPSTLPGKTTELPAPEVMTVSANESPDLAQLKLLAVAGQPAENPPPNEDEIAQAENLAQQLYTNICLYIRKNPRAFVPAMKNLRKNLENHCSADHAFSVAMQEFGKKNVAQARKRKRDANQAVTLQPNLDLNSLLQLETSTSQSPSSPGTAARSAASGLSPDQPIAASLILSLAQPIATTNTTATSSAPVFLPATPTGNSYLVSSVPLSADAPFTVTILSASPDVTSTLATSTESAVSSSDVLTPVSVTSSAHLDESIELSLSSATASTANTPLFTATASSVPSLEPLAIESSPAVEHSEILFSSDVKRPSELENHDYTLIVESCSEI